MRYDIILIRSEEIPTARFPVFQHLVDTYASETNKVHSVWVRFNDADLEFRPHARSSTVSEIMKHQLLSERRFFGEFLEAPEPPASEVMPEAQTVAGFASRYGELARRRLHFLAEKEESWWLGERPFFDVTRQRIWIFWRRVLHTAHHRTQLALYLRLLDKPVPAIYGPTADASWEGADPTTSVEAASRSGAKPER